MNNHHNNDQVLTNTALRILNENWMNCKGTKTKSKKEKIHIHRIIICEGAKNGKKETKKAKLEKRKNKFDQQSNAVSFVKGSVGHLQFL